MKSGEQMMSRRKLFGLGAGVSVTMLGLPGLIALLSRYADARQEHTSMRDGHDAASGEGKLPKGMIGMSLHIAAERVGSPALLYIGHLYPEGPAAKAGLKHGDEIVAVNGTPVAGKTHEELLSLIRGEVGTSVTLSVKEKDGSRTVTLERVGGETFSKKKAM